MTEPKKIKVQVIEDFFYFKKIPYQKTKRFAYPHAKAVRGSLKIYKLKGGDKNGQRL